jgi:uncharacterized protein
MTDPAAPGTLARIPRLAFPEDEARQSWLALLLTAYALVDAGVAEAVQQQEAQDRRLACHKGCAACCRSHTTIPVYPLELIGITWYAVEKLDGPVRERLIRQLRDYRKDGPCPLLVDDTCSIHPLRPMACRQFNVFDRVCAEGEDAYYTRRADVLTPIRAYPDAALDAMLLFHGVADEPQRRTLIESGEVHRLAKVLQDYDWPKLAERMQAFDARRATPDSPA